MLPNFKTISSRIISDYFVRDRFSEYEKLIEYFLDKGYNFLTLADFYSRCIEQRNFKGKLVLFRHDIDNNLKNAWKLFKIEKNYKIKSTFYFRISTLDVKLAREINAYGGEVGYHFEEIASLAKRKHIKKPAIIKKHYPEIRKSFLLNLQSIEEKIGFKIRSVASHGDFVNRYLGVINYDFLDTETKHKAGVQFEAYDLLKYTDEYISDASYPEFWKKSPYVAEKANIICFLIHSYCWRSNLIENSKNNFKRLIEGLDYKIF